MLKNVVTITIPTRCRCGEPVPEKDRRKSYGDALSKFSKWFGGATVYSAEDAWSSEDGSLAVEPVDVIESSASDEALEAAREEVVRLARDLADHLHQEAVTYTVNGVRFFEEGNPDLPCFHGVSRKMPPEARARREEIARLQGLEAALRALCDPAQGDPEERIAQLMARQFGYTYAQEPLSIDWSEEERRRMPQGRRPTVVARSEDGRFQAVLVVLRDERLLIRDQRPILERILRADPTRYFLFCVTGPRGAAWHLVNTPEPRADGRPGRRVFRRFRLESKDQPMRTIVERLSRIGIADRPGLSGREIKALHDDAFDVQALGETFFRDFRRYFEDLYRAVEGFTDDEERYLFTQQLCNRLLFLAFVARKGWLCFPHDDPRGSADYFQRLWEDYLRTEKLRQPRKANFYRDRLSALFFETLCVDHKASDPADRENLQRKIGRLLYLNGGLFEKSHLDWRKGLFVPDEPLERIIRSLLGGYNFTVMEATPFDEDVAVDPEMLGRMFERLVIGRHEKGSYYTPRNIVEFMCREALKGYLLRAVPGADEASVNRFVDEEEPGRLNPDTLLEALREVTVCDPACGSGAYLLGMLHELFRLRAAVFRPGGPSRHEDDYHRKLEIISRNLYGVDLDEFAVNIARLRLWLSLMVEYHGDEPPPLPNLDYQIECGDSLTGPSVRNRQQELFEHHLLMPQVEGFRKAKEAFLKAHGARRDSLREQVKKFRAQVRKLLDTASGAEIETGRKDRKDFRWELEFPEIIIRGGFDVILANPPYVRQESLGADYKALLKKRFPAVYDGKADLYCYFYARALDLLKPGGMIVFISSNSWLQSQFASKLRQVLHRTCDFHYLLNFNNSRIFSDANISPVIVVARIKTDGDPLRKSFCLNCDHLISESEDIQKLVLKEGVYLTERTFQPSAWILSSDEWSRKFECMRANGIPLGEYAKGKIHYGIKTGCNEAFVIDDAVRRRLIDEDPASAEIIRPLLRGRDIRKWHPEFAGRWLICTVHGTDISRYPAVERHLRKYKTQLEKRAPGNYQWFELQGSSAGLLANMCQPKILYQVIARKDYFCQDHDGSFVMNDKCFMIMGMDLFLLGVLNSRSCWKYITETCPILNTGAYQLRKPIMETVPIPRADKEQQTRLIRLVEKILAATPAEQKRHQSKLDQYVDELYGIA